VFANGGATTGFIEQDFNDDKTLSPHPLTADQQALAAWIFYLKSAQKYSQDIERTFWRNSNPAPTWFDLEHVGEKHLVGVNVVSAQDKSFSINVGEDVVNLSLVSFDEKVLTFIQEGIKQSIAFAFSEDGELFLESHEGCLMVEDKTHAPAVAADGAGNGQIKASMDGGIVDVVVSEGATVSKGDTLVVLEAMKMEHAMKADIDGVIKAIHVSKGDQVKGRQLLVEVEANQAEAQPEAEPA